MGGTPPARPRPGHVRTTAALILATALSAFALAPDAAATPQTPLKTADTGSPTTHWLGTPPAPANPENPGAPAKQPDTSLPPAPNDSQADLHKAMQDAAAKAKASNTPIPVGTMTDDYSQTVANPDGSFGYTQSVAPVRTKKNDAWVPIDTTLVKAADGSWHPSAAAVSLTISGGGNGPLVVLDDNAGHTESLTWPSPLPAPHVDGNDAVFPEVLPGVDLRIAADSLGFRQILIVKTAQAAANPALATIHFGFSTKNLTTSPDADGQLRSLDAKGATVFTSGTAGMWDSAPTGAAAAQAVAGATANSTVPDPADGPSPDARQTTVKTTLTASGIDVATDTAMLANPNTRFPVYIDPPASNKPLIAHAEIWQGLPTRAGDPTACCNTNVTRVGWSTASPGAVRALFQFANDIPSTATITESKFKLTTETGTTTPVDTEVWQLDQFPTDANGTPTGSLMTWNSATGSGGAWTPYDSNVKRIDTFHIGGTGAGYRPETDNKGQMQNIVDNSGRYVTLGVKSATETASAGGWQVFWWNSNISADNATLTVTYLMPPWITRLWTSPGTIKGNSCDTNKAGPDYITKTVGGIIQANAGVGDIDAGQTAQVWFGLRDLDATGNDIAVAQTTVNTVAQPGEAPTSTNFYQDPPPQNPQTWKLLDGHRYQLSATADSAVLKRQVQAPTSCYFTVAFTSPDPPDVSSTDFPRVGGTPTKLATAPGAFQISGTTKGVRIAGFEYVINGDSSAAQAVNLPTPGPDATSGAGYVRADASGRATIYLPQGATQMGTNSLLVRAVDVAGNRSPFSSYDFFTPGNPDLQPAYGNVTGDGMADIVAIGPDGHGAQRLVVFPSDIDPNTANTSNATEAAPASAAPDGASWADTLFTHRGADRSSPTDDLFAYSTKTHQLFYYLNSVVRKAGVLPADQFVQTHQALVTRPACTAAPQVCARYAIDWSKVLNIVALGPVAGGTANTFGGKTSFLTIEDDDNGGGNLWLFSPGLAAGQLKNPQLIGTSDLSRHTGLMPNGWNWATVDLIAPGSATPGGLPDLWARDRQTGNLIQFTNTKNAAGAEDPTSLGNLDSATLVGDTGQFTTKSYPTLISGGSPAVDGSDGTVPAGSTAGTSHQTGARALWSLNTKGQLQLLPGPITAASTLPHKAWSTTADRWVSDSGVTEINGAGVRGSTGPIQLGVDQTSGNQMCLDLADGKPDNGTMVRSWTCNGTAAQIWTFNANGTITSAINSDKCLDITSNPITSDGTMNRTPVQIWDCGGTKNQQWTLRNSVNAATAGKPGWLNFYNPHSGRCLDNPDNNTGWQQMWIADCNDLQAQQWLAPSAAGSPQQIETEDLWVENAAPMPYAEASCCGVTLSNGNQVHFPGTAANQSFTLDWNVPQPGTYTIEPMLTKANDRARVSLTIDNGQPLPNEFDGYQADGVSEVSYPFGAATLSAGIHKFTFTTTSTNPGSAGSRYVIGVDTLKLTPVIGTGPIASAVQPPSALTGVGMTVDASASRGGASALTNIKFDFGDGSTSTNGTQTTASHTYTTTGNYTVTVTATDGAGKSASAYKTLIVSSGPSSAWKLNEGTGTTAADTGTSAAFPATLAGGSSLAPGGYGTFDGASGYAATASRAVDTTKSFTVATWVKLNTLNGYQTFVTEQGSQAGGFHLEFENNGAQGNTWSFVRATSDTSSASYLRLNSPAGMPQTGVWTHLVGTWNATTGAMTLYVNGQLVGTTTDTSPVAATGPLVIGRGYANGTANNYVNGAIADVRIYQQALGNDLAPWLYQNTGFAGAGYVNPPSTTNPAYTFAGTADWNGDGNPDLIARDNATCNLYAYLGQGTASEIPAARTLIGNGWCNLTFAGLADWQHTGLPGIIARDETTGTVWFYPNTGSRVQVGTGWSGFTFVGIADWNHDGHYDIIAREDGSEVLWCYPGDATGGGGGSRIQIGTGWGPYTFSGIVDGNRDGHYDVIAREDTSNNVFEYPGDATGGGGGSRIQIGTGWGGMTFAGVTDWDKDGYADILARTPYNGMLRAYNRNATPGATVSVVQIGTGW